MEGAVRQSLVRESWGRYEHYCERGLGLQRPRSSLKELEIVLLNLSVKFGCHCPDRRRSCLVMKERQGEQMVGDFILFLALIQLSAVVAITAVVVGGLFLIYRSVPNRSPEICGGVEK